MGYVLIDENTEIMYRILAVLEEIRDLLKNESVHKQD